MDSVSGYERVDSLAGDVAAAGFVGVVLMVVVVAFIIGMDWLDDLCERWYSGDGNKQ